MASTNKSKAWWVDCIATYKNVECSVPPSVILLNIDWDSDLSYRAKKFLKKKKPAYEQPLDWAFDRFVQRKLRDHCSYPPEEFGLRQKVNRIRHKIKCSLEQDFRVLRVDELAEEIYRRRQEERENGKARRQEFQNQSARCQEEFQNQSARRQEDFLNQMSLFQMIAPEFQLQQPRVESGAIPMTSKSTSATARQEPMEEYVHSAVTEIHSNTLVPRELNIPLQDKKLFLKEDDMVSLLSEPSTRPRKRQQQDNGEIKQMQDCDYKPSDKTNLELENMFAFAELQSRCMAIWGDGWLEAATLENHQN